MDVGHTVAKSECIDVDGAVRGLSCNVLVERVPRNALHIVGVLSKCEHAFPCGVLVEPLLSSAGGSPVDAFQIVAVLSVDPAMKNSPSGLQARS